MKISTFITLLHLTFANKPIERENGIWYPGKGCGITTEIKYLSEVPNDVSDLTCTFIQNPRKVKFKDLKMNPECFKTGNPDNGRAYTFKKPVKTVEDCMELCLNSGKCEVIEYWQIYEDCYLIEEDLPMPIIADNDARAVHASKSCILQNW